MKLRGLKRLPPRSRHTYTFELKHVALFSLLAGLVEGQFASVVVATTFFGSEMLIAVASATPMAAMLFSLAWGVLAVGRSKIALLRLFAAGTAVSVGMAALIPTTPTGALWFVCQMAVAQVLLSGVVTVRSAVWKSNYPAEQRGRVTAGLQALRRMVTVVTVLIAARVCDMDPAAYKLLFPAAALCGIASTLFLQRIRIYGEGRQAAQRPSEHRTGPTGITAAFSPRRLVAEMIRVLRQDQRFRRYCIAQLLTGSANLMTLAIIVTLVTRRLDLGSEWALWISTALIVALPNLTLLGSIRRWAGLFDRLGVVRMRVVNVACWAASLVAAAAAAWVVLRSDRFGPSHLPIAVGLFAVRGLLNGLGLGGGTLAWNLGHLHFAKPQTAEIYMGVHVSLTGLRGLFAPILGMWLWQAVGWSVWPIAIGLSLSSLLVYAMMAREENAARDAGTTRPGPAAMH